MWTRSKRRYVDGRQLEFFWLSTTTNHKNPEIRMHSVSRLHFWSQSIPYYPTFILCHSFHISQTCDDPPRALEWIFDWQGLTQKEFLVQSVGCISEVKVLHTIPTSSSFMLSIEISQTCDDRPRSFEWILEWFDSSCINSICTASEGRHVDEHSLKFCEYQQPQTTNVLVNSLV